MSWFEAGLYGSAAGAMTWVILMLILHGNEIIERIVSLIVDLNNH